MQLNNGVQKLNVVCIMLLLAFLYEVVLINRCFMYRMRDVNMNFDYSYEHIHFIWQWGLAYRLLLMNYIRFSSSIKTMKSHDCDKEFLSENSQTGSTNFSCGSSALNVFRCYEAVSAVHNNSGLAASLSWQQQESRLCSCSIGLIAFLSHSRVRDSIHSRVCNATRQCGLIRAEPHAITNPRDSR